jgi:cardiolipin synthase A/B
MTILIILLAIILILQIAVLGSIIFLENRDPARTIVWLLVLGVLPILGAVIYLVFGRTFRRRKLARYRNASQKRLEHIIKNQRKLLGSNDIMLGDKVPQKKKLVRLLVDNSLAPLTQNNRAQVLTNGVETFKAIFEALEAAEHHIHLEYYIFKYDEVGKDVIEILTKKVRAGVKVRVLVDGWGSLKFSKELAELKKVGVAAEWFFPVKFPFFSSKLNNRNHRKIIVVDGKVGFIGGLNIGDEYLSRDKQFGFWRDTFLRLEGESVHLVQTIFLNDWFFVTQEDVTERKYFPKPIPVGDQLTQIATSGPDSDWESLLQVFFTAINGAEKSIYIETPYFVPDESTLMAIKTAARSGLDVRLIFQGIADHKLTFWASHSYFEELLEAGVRIYHYQKGILHAKIFIVDGEIGSLGSTNFDNRSFRINFEINAFIYNREFAKRLEQDFDQDILDSVEIDYEEFRHRPFANRVKESSARLLSPIL